MVVQIVIREQQFVREIMIFDNLVRYAIRNVHRLANISVYQFGSNLFLIPIGKKDVFLFIFRLAIAKESANP